MRKTSVKHLGFSLAELLIVVTVIMLLAIVLYTNWQKQIIRGYDAKRKTDLGVLKRAFEDYYNDKDCYPSQTQWNSFVCDGSQLVPYIAKIPCDPQTREKYFYTTIADGFGGECGGYRALAGLGDLQDSDIPAQGCSPQAGCGYGAKWNYGISTGGSVPAPGFDPGVTPTPTPTPTPPFSQGSWFKPPNPQQCQSIGPQRADCLRNLGCFGFSTANACEYYGQQYICVNYQQCF